MLPSRDKLTASLRWLTLGLATGVAAFVPVMQVLVDRTWPTLSKPVWCGLAVGLALCGLCLFSTRWHKRLLFMCLVGLFTLGLTEIMCSVVSGAMSGSIHVWDPDCLYRLRPKSWTTFQKTSINGGERIPISVNSLGFRGPEIRWDHKIRRIMVFGDSFVEAEYSRLENTFVEQLNKEVSPHSNAEIETVNAGVIGYGPDQMLLRMEHDVRMLRPALVIACFFADNDLGDPLRNKLFQLNESGELEPHAWQLAPDCRHPGLRAAYEPTLWKWTRNAVRGLQSQGSVMESYMERWLKQSIDEYEDYIRRHDPIIRDLQVDHYDADVSLAPFCESACYKAKLFSRILERMAVVCQENSAQFLVVIIPSPADLIENYDFCAIDRAKFPQYRRHAISRVMSRAANRLGIPHVNLFHRFETSDPKRLYFRGGDNHWNDLGQQIAAEEVAKKVVPMLKGH